MLSFISFFKEKHRRAVHSLVAGSQAPLPFPTPTPNCSLSCFKADCLFLPICNCTERLMPVNVKGGFLSLCLMAVLLSLWLFIYVWCLLLLAAVTRRLAAAQCYFLYVFHGIISFLFQKNINILMQFVPLINERSKSIHFFILHSLNSISYSCMYPRVYELIICLEIFILMQKKRDSYCLATLLFFTLAPSNKRQNVRKRRVVWQQNIFWPSDVAIFVFLPGPIALQLFSDCCR